MGGHSNIPEEPSGAARGSQFPWARLHDFLCLTVIPLKRSFVKKKHVFARTGQHTTNCQKACPKPATMSQPIKESALPLVFESINEAV